jgi:hypothetical protein
VITVKRMTNDFLDERKLMNMHLELFIWYVSEFEFCKVSEFDLKKMLIYSM